jgi:hypothetical protein
MGLNVTVSQTYQPASGGGGGYAVATLADVQAGFSGVAVVGGVTMNFSNGYILVGSIFRLKLGGTGAVTVDTIDHLNVIALNVFTYALPADTGVKRFDSENIIGIKITYSTSATVSYID